MKLELSTSVKILFLFPLSLNLMINLKSLFWTKNSQVSWSKSLNPLFAWVACFLFADSAFTEFIGEGITRTIRVQALV